VNAAHGVAVSAKDVAILADRAAARDRISGPRVGDFIEFAGGGLGRFTHDCGADIQTTVRDGSFGEGSFYLSESGGLSYSGSLDPAVRKRDLAPTGKHRDGAVWFFHDGFMAAHSGVYAVVPCRVYREVRR
jgi:hypothetical protein